MTWQREPDISRSWNLEPQPRPLLWDLQPSAAVQTRWDDGLTVWDGDNPQPTLWDLGLTLNERWARQ